MKLHRIGYDKITKKRVQNGFWNAKLEKKIFLIFSDALRAELKIKIGPKKRMEIVERERV